MEITCKDCWAFGDTHSSCIKVRNYEVDENTPACKNIKYIKKCRRDCALYNDINNCRRDSYERTTLACENIILRKETIELLNKIKRELLSTQDHTTPKSKKLKLNN